MEKQFDFDVLLKLKQKKRRKSWKGLLSVMMCVVVFCTTYMLILPAITKENQTFCGIEEHIHDEACYEKLMICEEHVHSEECNKSEANLICTQPTDDGHTHGEACQPVTESVLICETEESAGHSHDESCGFVTEYILSCQTEESEGHIHSDECYTAVISALCGMEESSGHIHDDSCYGIATAYGCGMEEVSPSHTHDEACYEIIQHSCTLEATPDHEHSDACYEQKLICEAEEHTHSIACFADLSADQETPAMWEATLPQLSGNQLQDLLAIAESQLGYAESGLNYIVDENDYVQGYTRYGAWYGSAYGEWCAMFVSFCLHYAGMDEVPTDAYCPSWVEKLQAMNLYKIPSEYVPKAGDIIFFDWEGDGVINHVGLVDEVLGAEIFTIEGNSGGVVAKKMYEMHDKCIAGYGALNEFRSSEDPANIVPENTDAWADLLIPADLGGEALQAQEEAAAEENSLARARFAAPTTYSLRRTSSTYQVQPRAAGSLELDPYINSVTMYDEAGNVIPSGSVVTEGDMIEFKIEYTVTGQQLGVMNGETVSLISDTLTYDLPDIFQIVQSNSGNIYNSSGQVVGTFVIDNDAGTVTLKFSESYVEQNAKGIQIHGHVSFFSQVVKITDDDNEEQDYKFTDGIILGVIIEEKVEAEGDLKIEKSKVSVDGEDIIYEIKVTSAEGTNGPITITDRMSEGLTFEEGISVRKGNSTVSARFNAANDRRSFSLSLPEMAPGDTYTVRYRCSADINLLGTDMTVRNTATVTGKDSQDHELKDNVTVDHTFDVLEKTGVLNDDGSITWTITINHAKADISGWTLVDIMRIGNEQVPYTEPVTIRGSSGNIVARNVVLPYTFPNGSTDTYTVTYTTNHDFGDGSTIYNSAILRDDNTDVTVLEGVVVGSPFTKSGETGEVIQDENGTYLLPVTWTVTIDTTKAPITGGLYFVDEFRGYPSDDMYMTYDQLMVALANFEAKVEGITGQELEWLSAWVYAPGPDTSNEVYGIIDLWNNVNGCQSKKFDRFAISLGSKGIPQGHVISFSYEAYGLFPNNIVSTTSYVNRFNLMDQYEVEGRVNYTEGTLKATKYGIKYYDPEKHADQFWFWGETDWGGEGSITQLDYNSLKDSYLAWTIELSAPPGHGSQDNITMYEDLPEGVTVKDVKLVFQNGMPPTSTPLVLRDVEPGKNYKWEFLLYTAEQYISWDRTNGQPVSIDVKVTEAGDLEISIPGNVLEVMSKYAELQNIEESYGYLTIVTQINDDFGWTPEAEGSQVYINTFENKFTIKTDKDVVIDVGSQSQQIKKDESDGAVRKQATANADNIITYSVVLNAYGKDLIKNSEVLAVHDELSYTSTAEKPLRVRLVPGSVKLYEVRVRSDGTYEKLGEVTTNYKYAETSSVQGGITTWVHTIDLNIPDGKSLLLEYSYKASGVKAVQHEVFNACSITGVGEGELEGDTKVEIEVKDSTAQADTKGIMIYKVDASSDGLFLEKAKFNIYIWNEEQNKYIIVHHPDNGGTDFVTDANGMIVLDSSTMDDEQFAYNTAYYIVEVESPDGYYLSPEPYYFYIVNENVDQYPSCIPEGFNGHALYSGDIIYRQNVSDTTEISIEKYWKDYGGDPIAVTKDNVSNITIELWQMLRGDPGSAKLFGTYTMTPDENGNWSLTISGLPKATANVNGTKGTDYLYYIKEVSAPGFELESAENNAGINSGTIKLVNREVEGYLLPQTGGAGTKLYTAAGLLLMLSSTAYLVYIKKKGRREDFYNSSG